MDQLTLAIKSDQIQLILLSLGLDINALNSSPDGMQVLIKALVERYKKWESIMLISKELGENSPYDYSKSNHLFDSVSKADFEGVSGVAGVHCQNHLLLSLAQLVDRSWVQRF